MVFTFQYLGQSQVIQKLSLDKYGVYFGQIHFSAALLKIIFPGQERHLKAIESKWVFEGHPTQWVPFQIGWSNGHFTQFLELLSKWVLSGHA